MRTLLSILLLAASLSGQGSPNCSGAGSFVDARCACERDPAGKLCEMVKAGMYEARVSGKTIDPFRSGLIGYRTPPTPGGIARRPLTTAQPASKARVVALAHKDYLRFLHPNAQLAIGVDFQKAVSMSAVTGVLFGEEDGTISPKAVAALKEIDHLWMSVAGPRMRQRLTRRCQPHWQE